MLSVGGEATAAAQAALRPSEGADWASCPGRSGFPEKSAPSEVHVWQITGKQTWFSLRVCSTIADIPTGFLDIIKIILLKEAFKEENDRK